MILNKLYIYCQENQMDQEYLNEIEKVLRVQNAEMLFIKKDGYHLIKNYKDVYNSYPWKKKLKVIFPFLRNC